MAYSGKGAFACLDCLVSQARETQPLLLPCSPGIPTEDKDKGWFTVGPFSSVFTS